LMSELLPAHPAKVSSCDLHCVMVAVKNEKPPSVRMRSLCDARAHRRERELTGWCEVHRLLSHRERRRQLVCKRPRETTSYRNAAPISHSFRRRRKRRARENGRGESPYLASV
jgi:hypothetical protein